MTLAKYDWKLANSEIFHWNIANSEPCSGTLPMVKLAAEHCQQ